MVKRRNEWYLVKGVPTKYIQADKELIRVRDILAGDTGISKAEITNKVGLYLRENYDDVRNRIEREKETLPVLKKKRGVFF